MAGINIVRISYKTGSQQVADILSGQVQLQFNSLDGYQDHLKSGRLRALAVGSVKPSVLLPGVPTMASTLPGFESVVVIGMFAPARTPKAVINRLNQEVVRALNKEDVKARILSIAVEPVGSSPEGLAAAVVADMARFGKLIKDAGISAQ
jgi:tripartite-type tricarboxylate transporter receptor subunit TctC